MQFKTWPRFRPANLSFYMIHGSTILLSGLGDICQQKYEKLDRKEDLHDSHLHHHDFIPNYKFLDKINEKFPE